MRFFFQAEDGIRDGHVTGVQTCALPICTKNVVPSNQHRGPDKGGDDHVSAEWITQLTEAGRERIEIGGMGTPYIHGHEVYGYQLLGSLLGEGDHTPHFLNRVGSDMLWFEQSYADEHDGDLPWD